MDASVINQRKLMFFFLLLAIFSPSDVNANRLTNCGYPSDTIFETSDEAYKAAYACGIAVATIMRDNRLEDNPNRDLPLPNELFPHCYGRGSLVGYPSIYRNCNNGRCAYGFSIYRPRGSCGAYGSFWSYASGGGHFRYKKECYPPFANEENECVTYCPPEKPDFDNETGLCVADYETIDCEEQCEFNPVVVSNGEKVQTEIDLILNSPFPLKVTRKYRSFQSEVAKQQLYKNLRNIILPPKSHKPTYVRHVQPSRKYPHVKYDDNILRFVNGLRTEGHKSWTFNLFPYLVGTYKSTSIYIKYQDKTLTFKKSDDEYVAQHINASTLTINDTLWAFFSESGEKLTFDSKGKIVEVINANGLAHHYNWQKNFVTITDDFNNHLKVTFDYGKRIKNIQSSTGMNIDYSYDAISNLIAVNKRTTSSAVNDVVNLKKQYHYENTSLPYALTGITDEKGIRYATWEYDAVGRVTKSSHVNNVDNGTLSYEKNTTTATNALGKQTKYHYDMIAGTKRLISVEGVATQSCQAANKAYTYHPTGQIKTQTDWEGKVTYFEYNNKGAITKRTQGYGTPEAYTVETSWHETLNKPVLITTPDKQEKYQYNAQGKLINKSVTALK